MVSYSPGPCTGLLTHRTVYPELRLSPCVSALMDSPQQPGEDRRCCLEASWTGPPCPVGTHFSRRPDSCHSSPSVTPPWGANLGCRPLPGTNSLWLLQPHDDHPKISDFNGGCLFICQICSLLGLRAEVHTSPMWLQLGHLGGN